MIVDYCDYVVTNEQKIYSLQEEKMNNAFSFYSLLDKADQI